MSAQQGASTRAASPPLYGGQAVIEGVMIRGRRAMCVAVRRPNGEITHKVTPLSTFYTGTLRRLPLVRGVVVLAETLVLGMKALTFSTNVQLEEEGKELGGWGMAAMMTVSMVFAVVLFFLLPLVVVQVFDRYMESDILSNLVEGVVRLGIFLGYVGGVGLIPDIRRVFAYHGAEHMAVKANEARDPLDVAHVRKYTTAHPRCGTAFLLVVMVVAILVFVWLGRPPLVWRIASRVVLIPVIAGVSYEVIRLSARYQGNPLVRLVTAPSLLLQALTTRKPDDAQIEVAIHAMNTALAVDEGREVPAAVLPAPQERPPEGGASAR